MRKKLKHDLRKFKTFTQKNEYIDKKIEYDQRFYNDGYAEFQLMISDIRKQIRLNDQVMQLRKQLHEAYCQICSENCDEEGHNHHKDVIRDQYKIQKSKLDAAKDQANLTSIKLVQSLEKLSNLKAEADENSKKL